MGGYRNLGEVNVIPKEKESTSDDALIEDTTIDTIPLPPTNNTILDVKFLWNNNSIDKTAVRIGSNRSKNEVIITNKSDGIIRIYSATHEGNHNNITTASATNSACSLKPLYNLVLEEENNDSNNNIPLFSHGIFGSYKMSIVNNENDDNNSSSGSSKDKGSLLLLSIASISLHGIMRLWKVKQQNAVAEAEDIKPWKVIKVSSATGTNITMTPLSLSNNNDDLLCYCCAIGCNDGSIMLIKINESNQECVTYHQKPSNYVSCVRSCVWKKRKNDENDLILAIGRSNGDVNTCVLKEDEGGELYLNHLHCLMQHPSSINDLLHANDLALFLSMDNSGLVRIYDTYSSSKSTSTSSLSFPLVGSLTATKNEKTNIISICSIAISSNANVIAISTRNKIQLYDLSFASMSSSSLPIHLFHLHEDNNVTCMHFNEFNNDESCDGNNKERLICGTDNGKLYLFSV